MTVFLIDAIATIFPSVIISLIFGAGMILSKEKSKRVGWWTAGLVIFAVYSFGNLTLEDANHNTVWVGAIVVALFYYLMVARKQRTNSKGK